MDTTNIKRWIAALRSGEYNQTRGKLRDDRGMCCLGVASDLYPYGYFGEFQAEGYVFHMDDGAVTLDEALDATSEVELLTPVQEWLALPSTEIPVGVVSRYYPEVLPSKYQARQNIDLAVLNDYGATFNQIADLIEARWIRGEVE